MLMNLIHMGLNIILPEDNIGCVRLMRTEIDSTFYFWTISEFQVVF